MCRHVWQARVSLHSKQNKFGKVSFIWAFCNLCMPLVCKCAYFNNLPTCGGGLERHVSPTAHYSSARNFPFFITHAWTVNLWTEGILWVGFDVVAWYGIFILTHSCHRLHSMTTQSINYFSVTSVRWSAIHYLWRTPTRQLCYLFTNVLYLLLWSVDYVDNILPNHC